MKIKRGKIISMKISIIIFRERESELHGMISYLLLLGILLVLFFLKTNMAFKLFQVFRVVLFLTSLILV